MTEEAAARVRQRLERAYQRHRKAAKRNSLKSIRDIRFVPGEGNTLARVMLVGEAPGADEQRAGRPFVGMSGHMVDVQLRINGLTRDEVYITNVVKWRPVNRYGQNRKPTPSEIADSIDCVMEEITCINPDVLVTLGAVPLSLFSTAPISACHGRSEQIMLGANPVSLLPMYHPAYIARQRQLEKSYVQEWTVLSQYKSSP